MNLVETTFLSKWPIPMEIMYDKWSEFIGREFRTSLIETEYSITSKPSILGNPTSNAILERIRQVLGNLVQIFNITETYVGKDDPWLVILDAASFATF